MTEIVEKCYRFKLERIEWNSWYWTLTTQFFRNLDDVESRYKMRLFYDDSGFDSRIEDVRNEFGKNKKKIKDVLFQEQLKALEEEAKKEIDQIEGERLDALENNPDILFSVDRNEVKEKSRWTLTKRSIYDKSVITRINEKIEGLSNYKLWLSGS